MSHRIIVYSSGTTEDWQATQLCKDHSGLKFGTFYPGGLYGTCDFFIPCGVRNPLILLGGRRIAIYSGLRVVWEGEIDNTFIAKQDSTEGLNVECTGKWGSLLMRRRWNNIWADTRLDQAIWSWQNTAGTVILFRNERKDGLYVYPAVATFGTADYGAFRYTIPSNLDIAKVSFSYDFQEGAQAWSMSVQDVTHGTALAGEVTGSRTDSYSGTPANGCKALELRFNSKAAQSIANYNSGIYTKFTNVKLYADSAYGTVTPSNAIKDIQDHYTEINSDEAFIADNPMVLEPLFMEWKQTAADFITVTSSYGDASYNAWAAGLLASTEAAVPDGKPVIYYEQQPAITSADYLIKIDEMVNPITLGRVYDEIYNYIIVECTDVNNNRVYYTPDDFSTLKNQDSIDKYGQRDYTLSLTNMGTAEAMNYAYRFKAIHQWSQFRLSGQIQVKSTIRNANWGRIPVSWVRAGKRIMVENYLQEIMGASAIFLISQTGYDEESDIITISTGSPDPLAVLGAQLKRGKV